jgi:hypothetical protein
MELVAGQPLTQYCDEHKLSREQRLDVSKDASASVQHALKNDSTRYEIMPSVTVSA